MRLFVQAQRPIVHETQQVAGTGVRLCYFLWLLKSNKNDKVC